jgi:hypothetical protein
MTSGPTCARASRSARRPRLAPSASRPPSFRCGGRLGCGERRRRRDDGRNGVRPIGQRRLRGRQRHPEWGAGLNSNTGGAPSEGFSQQKLLDQTKGMQEMMASFNLQYLQLQEKMQQENRSFSTISNVMKTKHDTAKSSINNVR